MKKLVIAVAFSLSALAPILVVADPVVIQSAENRFESGVVVQLWNEKNRFLVVLDPVSAYFYLYKDSDQFTEKLKNLVDSKRFEKIVRIEVGAENRILSVTMR